MCIRDSLPAERGIEVRLILTRPDGDTVEQIAYTSSDGSYELVAFKPDITGKWKVQAVLFGDDMHSPSESSYAHFMVNDTWLNQYKIPIYVAAVAAIVVAMILPLYLKRRRQIEEG